MNQIILGFFLIKMLSIQLGDLIIYK